jgi:serine/threonine-protein kinase RsbW
LSHPLPLFAPPTLRPAAAASFTARCTADLPRVINGVAESMTRHGYPRRDVFAVRLALEEALINSLKHGHGHDPSKVVRVRCRVTRGAVLVRAEDQGPGFDPGKVADPLDPENLGRPCGRGLLLMRHYMDWVRYGRGGRRITLCKRRSQGGPA